MNKKLLVSIAVVSLCVGFGGGLIYGKSRDLPASINNLINRTASSPQNIDLDQFWEAWDILHADYVDRDKIDDKKLLFGAIDGLVKSIGDPYTVFLPPAESQKFLQEISGSFGGVGIEIGIRNQILTVIAPIKDTPAYRAGLLAGDRIIKIGEKTTENMKVEEAVSLIRGPKGTPVKLTFLRNGGKDPREVSLIRETIKIPSVDWSLIDAETAHIEIFVFNQNVDDEFQKIAKEIKQSKAKSIILDLRNNPGGLLDSSVNIASYFLDAGLPVTIERFGDGKENVFKTQNNGLLKNYPLTIIINKGSASASEILAGALKDHRDLTIVGETSFGKGSVQQVKDLDDGASLKITIAKWLTPKGRSISDQGISPDVEVKRTEEDVNANRDPQLEKAKELIKNNK